jgi:hypothetical protein
MPWHLFATIIFALKGNSWIKRHGEMLLIAIGLITLGFLLAAKWQTQLSSDVIFAGLLPNSDAAGYFTGALHFLQHGELTNWTTRRPLSTLHLAGLLGGGRSALTHVLFILTAFSAGAILSVVAVLGRSIGVGASAVTAAILIPFYFPTVGTVMSENMGLTLGGCGFALMWLSIHETKRRQISLFAFGAGLMGLGLVTRAGAMFVLPALILYAGWQFRGANRFSIKATIWTGAAIGLAFATNAAVIALFGAPGGTGFSNFSYTLYGLVTGGHPWEYIYQNVPTLKSLPEMAQAQEAYRLALAHLAAHPLDAVQGVIRRYNDFIFNALWFRVEGIGALRFLFVTLALVGLFHVIRQRHAPAESFVLVGTIGTFLSVPFIGDGGMRVHAATVAFSAALAGLGANTIAGWFHCPALENRDGSGITPIPIILAVFILLPMTSATALRGQNQLPLNSMTCPGKAYPVALTILPDAGVDLLSDKDIRKIKTGLLRGVKPPQGFAQLKPPIRLGVAITLSRKKGKTLWIASTAGQPLPRRFQACALPVGDIYHLTEVRAFP